MLKLNIKQKGFPFRSLVVFLLVFVLSQGVWAATVSAASSGKTSSTTYAVSETSVRLFEKVMAQEKQGRNLLISPDSILTAIAMVENGAAGKTLQEFEKALGGISVKSYSQYLSKLHKRIMNSKLHTYSNSNSIWYKKGALTLKKSYKKKVASYFSAEVKAASFLDRTVQKVNAWVSEKTNGKITKILDHLDASARILAINAVYLKGNWEKPYEVTKKYTFTSETGTKKKVPMLIGQETNYVNIAGAEGFVKYYSGRQLAFMALLPPKGTTLKQYVKGLTGKALIDGYQNRTTKGVIVNTRLPKFKYEYFLSLKKPLQKLGMKQAFSSQANFSNMTSKAVNIDDILHKTYIDLNKDGTEAAAVTAIVMEASSAYDPERIVKQVYLNRPFLYVILDTQTGVPLFLGAINQL